MNISPVSFGKVIKANGSAQAVQKAACLINAHSDKNEPNQMQEDLKHIFSDASSYKAQVIEFNNRERYILSGVDSEEAEYLRRDALHEIDKAAQFYNQGDLFDIELEVQMDAYRSKLENLIYENLDARELTIGFDERNSKITSVDFRA